MHISNRRLATRIYEELKRKREKKSEKQMTSSNMDYEYKHRFFKGQCKFLTRSHHSSIQTSVIQVKQKIKTPVTKFIMGNEQMSNWS